MAKKNIGDILGMSETVGSVASNTVNGKDIKKERTKLNLEDTKKKLITVPVVWEDLIREKFGKTMPFNTYIYQALREKLERDGLL
ncbi:MAG: hypothetical protein M0R46_10080 [Candidatus Muirbacterium halophilum]|nr:hypothetical protein [Candidatus Muirbacterium halophilum]